MFEEQPSWNKKDTPTPTKLIYFLAQLVRGSMFHWEKTLMLDIIVFSNSFFLSDFCVQLEIFLLSHLLAIKYWLLPVLLPLAIFMPSSWQSLGGTHAQFGLLRSVQEVTVCLYVAQNNFLYCLLILKSYWSDLAMASCQTPTWLLSVSLLNDMGTENKMSKLKGCFSNCSPQHQAGSALPNLDEVLILACTLWPQEKDFGKTIIILKYALFYGVAALYELV